MDIKLKAFKKSVLSLSQLFSLNLQDYESNPVVIDGLKNGIAQKFEYTTELCWKTIKKFLQEKEGIESKSPKQSIKIFFDTGYLTEADYLLLIEILVSRNELSHVYDEETFEKIIGKIAIYLPIFHRVLLILEQNWE